jgi:hypothetical protein
MFSEFLKKLNTNYRSLKKKIKDMMAMQDDQ